MIPQKVVGVVAICGTSGGRAVAGQWAGFDLLIKGGDSLLLLQVLNFNVVHFSNWFLLAKQSSKFYVQRPLSQKY